MNAGGEALDEDEDELVLDVALDVGLVVESVEVELEVVIEEVVVDEVVVEVDGVAALVDSVSEVVVLVGELDPSVRYTPIAATAITTTTTPMIT